MAFLLGAGALLYGQATGDALFIHQNGNVGIGTNTPKAQLDVQQSTRTSPANHPNAVTGLYVTGDLGPVSGIEFRHSNGTQGIGFGYNTIYATGSNADQDLNIKARGAGKIKVQGVLEGTGAVPKGAILMWSGDPGKLPAGGVLCDGNKGTPNLKGRFIAGYDPDDADYNAPHKTGGAKAHALTIAELPAHAHTGATDSHTIKLRLTGSIGSMHGLAKAANQGEWMDGHAHKFTTDTVGGGQPHESRPPYYVLAYIMYTGE